MNHLVVLDARAGELEKILSGVKTMLVKDFDVGASLCGRPTPAGAAAHPVNPGDSLYFLRDQDDCAVRVKATVVRVLYLIDCLNEDLSHTLKEMQPKLQLTEEQYNHWAAMQQALLVEFTSAQKISVIQIAPEQISDRSDWIAWEDFSLITNAGT